MKLLTESSNEFQILFLVQKVHIPNIFSIAWKFVYGI